MNAVAADFTIRRERPDQPEVRALLDELDAYLSSLYEPDANHILDIESLLAAEVRFFVARDAAGRAVGTGAWRLGAADPATDGLAYGEVKRMMVAPAMRGRGLGAALLRTVEDSMRAEGLQLARLETGAEQREAVAMYRRHGYADCAPYGGYPDNGLSLFLGKRLAP